MDDHPVTLWGKLAEEQGWTLKPTRNRVMWYAPGGGTVLTTAPGTKVHPQDIRNTRSQLRRAGLVIDQEKPVARSTANLQPVPPEPPEEEGPTTADISRALDAFIDLVTEEVGNLRNEHEDFVKGMQRTVMELRGRVQGLERSLEALPAPVDVSGYVTATDLKRAVDGLDKTLRDALAENDPLGSFRAKMRGGRK